MKKQKCPFCGEIVPKVRPYKNQKERDKELMLAYQKGLIDGRKENEI